MTTTILHASFRHDYTGNWHSMTLKRTERGYRFATRAGDHGDEYSVTLLEGRVEFEQLLAWYRNRADYNEMKD